MRKKARELNDVIKMGRTQLQDAVPMTLGMEFSAFADTVYEDMQRIGEARNLIAEINMGATAIGTGIKQPSRLCGTCDAVFAGFDRYTGDKGKQYGGSHFRYRGICPAFRCP